MLEPPFNSEAKTTTYDSVVDKKANPEKFVIFDKNQAYPEYLLTIDS